MRYLPSVIAYSIALVPFVQWLYILFATVMWALGDPTYLRLPLFELGSILGSSVGVVLGFLAAVMASTTISPRSKLRWALAFGLLPNLAPLVWIYRTSNGFRETDASD